MLVKTGALSLMRVDSSFRSKLIDLERIAFYYYQAREILDI